MQELIECWRPDVLVLGVPYNMDGSESELTRRALGFGRKLQGRFGIPVETVDERLSSMEAEDLLRARRASGQLRRKVRREDVDATAAVVILERWLAECSGAE